MSSNASHAGLGRWVVIGVGVFVFAVFAAVLWYAYVEVMGLGAGGPPPLIRAEAGPIKRAPDDPGGMEIPNRDSAAARVFQENGDGIRRERILPRQDTALIEPEPEPVPEAPMPAAPTGVEAPASEPIEKLVAREPELTPMTPPAPPPAAAARPSITVTNRPPSAAAPPPAPARAAPAAPSRAAPPTPLAPPPQVAARTPPATVPPARSAPAASPTYRVQLGAFRSGAAANQAWIDLQRRQQASLGGLRPTVIEARTSAGTFYRLQAGPLASRDGAVQACAQIKAAGNDCFIVGPLP